MDDSLFPDRDGGTDKRATPRKSARGRGVEPAPASPTLHALRDALPTTLRLGTSSWGYPGWIGSVWAQEYTPQKLSKQRSEEHTSELQSLMRISYAVFCLQKKIHVITRDIKSTHIYNTNKTKTHRK